MKKFTFIGIILSVFIMTNSYSKKNQNSKFKSLDLFNKVIYLIEKNYYKEVDFNSLIEGSLKGMLSSLDPHSTFLDKNLFKKMKDDTEGEFGGIGIEVSFEKGILSIITAIEDTPAFEAGIQTGDLVIEINHQNVVGHSLDKAVDLMKGKIGEKLHLGVRRNNQKKLVHFDIIRKIIKIDPVKYRLVDGSYGVIRLVQFQKDSTRYVKKAIEQMKKNMNTKFNGFVLDLRGNPGGLLDEAVGVASLFLEKGVVVSTESRDPNVKDIRYVKKTVEKDLKTPLVILVDDGSASASEIVAGAIQDYKRGLIMGGQSYGKGTVQSITPIGNDVAIKLTISEYLTPLKRKIDKLGITPDRKLPSIASRKRNYLHDNQIDLAVKYLKSLKK